MQWKSIIVRDAKTQKKNRRRRKSFPIKGGEICVLVWQDETLAGKNFPEATRLMLVNNFPCVF